MADNNAAVVEISQRANTFRSSIVLQAENKYIDVKSILGLFTTLLGNHAYELHVHGPDAEEAKEAMAAVFEKYGLNVTIIGE
ncbi:HPr family phosphocarrier protein [Paenibacillus sp. ACRRX]|uniref:HPr family phosphocarrier protein n=1 Tax=Paenibacillus TaxID=44249 RepID=UPI000404F783|nr:MULTISPECIES: HPr family phosphocarrier protein [Paenibacillus]MCG7407628.1 HPr family phosphocarrier protein [Paenibacillus sp. ACRRX]MDK8180863.1 HPr family phosphocarrier protein [Paenibacillus sp. UMB4589-SE434]